MNPKTLLAVLICVVAAWLAACSPAPNTAAITGETLAARIAAGDAPVILDVRGPDEFAAGHIPGAINIPHTAIVDRIGELDGLQNDEIVVHCVSGRRAGMAEETLVAAGFAGVRPLEGHMQQWEADQHPIDR